jgi:hypothetical protein
MHEHQEGNTNAGIITDRNYGLATVALGPAFKEVLRLLCTHDLFPCQNSNKATKTQIEKARRALCAGGWEREFPNLQSSEPDRANLICALRTLEEARSRASLSQRRASLISKGDTSEKWLMAKKKMSQQKTFADRRMLALRCKESPAPGLQLLTCFTSR